MSKKFNRVTKGPSSLEIITIPNPAAGAEFSIPLPEGYTYLILSLTFGLVTSVVVAVRMAVIRSYLGDRILWIALGEGSQVASEDLIWNFACGGIRNDFSIFAPIMTADLPTRVFIPGGTRLDSQILFLDAGDQLYNIYAYVQKWPILED